jgi:hypothetical protein
MKFLVSRLRIGATSVARSHGKPETQGHEQSRNARGCLANADECPAANVVGICETPREMPLIGAVIIEKV